MKTLKTLGTAIAGEARSLCGTFRGRFSIAVVVAWQVIDGVADSEPWWMIAGRVALAPLWLLALVCCLTFLSGVAFALIHARRPKHSYVTLDLKDGRQRRGLLCEAPCCVRGRIKEALRSGGAVTWDLDDGSDVERFEGDEIEHWAVMPVDDPDPHGTHGTREAS